MLYHVLFIRIIIAYRDLVLLLESFSAVSYSQMRGYFPCMEPLGGVISAGLRLGCGDDALYVFSHCTHLPQVP